MGGNVRLLKRWSIRDWLTKVKKIRLDLHENLVLFTGLQDVLVFFLVENFVGFHSESLLFILIFLLIPLKLLCCGVMCTSLVIVHSCWGPCQENIGWWSSMVRPEIFVGPVCVTLFFAKFVLQVNLYSQHIARRVVEVQ